jgi:hypothetical protein
MLMTARNTTHVAGPGLPALLIVEIIVIVAIVTTRRNRGN